MALLKSLSRIPITGWESWSDVAALDGCRLQRHAKDEGFRLLDADGRCVHTGTKATCEQEIARRTAAGQAKPFRGEVVLLLHGVLRSSRNTAPLGKRLEEQGFTVVRLDYASACLPIERHAENLAGVVASLREASAVHLVGHSMGGLVIRRYLAGKPDPRVKRVVMLGTPNHGAEMADLFVDLKLFNYVFGPAGKELCTRGKCPPGAACPLPKGVEAAVVAGGLGNKMGFNPLLKTDNDGIVTVESARLPGACDFLRVPALHGMLMRKAEVADAVGRFLRAGKFQPAVKAAG